MVRSEIRPLEQDDACGPGDRRLSSRIGWAGFAGAAGMIRAGARLVSTGATFAVMTALAAHLLYEGLAMVASRIPA